MSDISNEITSIAIANGYDGNTPKTVTEAIDALTVALGGEADSASVVDAIKALAPNISGSGGGEGGGSEGLPWSESSVSFGVSFDQTLSENTTAVDEPFNLCVYDGTSPPSISDPSSITIYFGATITCDSTSSIMVPRDAKGFILLITHTADIGTITFTNYGSTSHIVPDDLQIYEPGVAGTYKSASFTIPDGVDFSSFPPTMHVVKTAS